MGQVSGKAQKKRAAKSDSLAFEKQKHSGHQTGDAIKFGRVRDVQTYRANFMQAGDSVKM
jgi:hypothetical protein